MGADEEELSVWVVAKAVTQPRKQGGMYPYLIADPVDNDSPK